MRGGATLSGVLLREGMVDEVSLLIDPSLGGGTSPCSLFVAPDLVYRHDAIGARLTHLEKLRNGVVWLRYDVIH